MMVIKQFLLEVRQYLQFKELIHKQALQKFNNYQILWIKLFKLKEDLLINLLRWQLKEIIIYKEEVLLRQALFNKEKQKLEIKFNFMDME